MLASAYVSLNLFRTGYPLVNLLSMNNDLKIGKFYEYVCPWSRPLLLEKKYGFGLPKRLSPTKYIYPGQTFILIGKMQRSQSHIKVYITESSEIGWIFTGVVNGTHSKEAAQEALEKLIRRLV